MSVKWIDLSRYGLTFGIASTNGAEGLIKPVITGDPEQLAKAEKTLRALGFSKQSEARWFINWTSAPSKAQWDEHFPMHQAKLLADIVERVALDEWSETALIERGAITQEDLDAGRERLSANETQRIEEWLDLTATGAPEASDPSNDNIQSDDSSPTEPPTETGRKEDEGNKGNQQDPKPTESSEDIEAGDSSEAEAETLEEATGGTPTDTANADAPVEEGGNSPQRPKPLFEAYGMTAAWLEAESTPTLTTFGSPAVLHLYKTELENCGFTVNNDGTATLSSNELNIGAVNANFPLAPIVEESSILEETEVDTTSPFDVSAMIAWSQVRELLKGKANRSEERFEIDDIREIAATASGIDQRLIRNEFGVSDRVLLEHLEAALTEQYRAGLTPDSDLVSIIDLGDSLDRMMPRTASKTSESIALQQFSTPFMISGALQYAIHVDSASRIWEPTIGNGSLVTLADRDAEIGGVELDEARVLRLREAGYQNVQHGDANTSIIEEPGSYSRVIANPPFGGFQDKEGARLFSTNVPAMDGGTQPEITLHSQDKFIALRHLEHLDPKGLGGLIIGADNPAKFKPGEMSMRTKVFLNFLSDNYHVLDIQYVDGGMYGSRGAGWPLIMATTGGKRDIIVEKELPDTLPVIKNKEQLLAFAEKSRALAMDYMVQEEPDLNEKQKQQGPRFEGTDDIQDSLEDEVDEATPEGADSSTRLYTVEEEDAEQTEESEPVNEGSERERWLEDRETGGESESNQRHANVNEKSTMYEPRSSMKSLDKRVPSNLAAPIKEALDRVEEAHGDIDYWVADELGWTLEEMGDRLAAEQVDAVALSMYQGEQGKGFILGDNTGVGKGRTVAALIAWGIKKGHKPIFCTSKAGLFHDMMRDMEDIGESALVKPFILNNGVSVTDPETGEELIEGTPQKTVTKGLKDGNIPEGYNCVFMTYSQVNVERFRSKKAEWLVKVAENNSLLFDEVHNASGSTSNTGENIRAAVRAADFTLGASATYAKRPDNLGLYEFTSMFAGSESEALIEAVANGGAEYQEVLSTMLAASGQLIVRSHRPAPAPEAKIVNPTYEEGFDGRGFVDRLARVLDAMTAIADEGEQIVNAENKEIKEFIEGLPDEAKGNYSDWKAQSLNFGSQAHNIVKVAMYAAKADAIVEEVAAEIQEGRRVTIALEGTMETFLREAHSSQVSKVLKEQEENRKEGDPAPVIGTISMDISYRDTLKNYLDRMVMIKRTDRYGEVTHEPFIANLEEYTEAHAKGDLVDLISEHVTKEIITPEEATRVKYYFAVIDTINALPASLPASPLDYVQHKLRERGIKTGEMTGRDLGLDYSTESGMPAFRHRGDEEKDRVKTANDFNNGEVQAVFFNGAASEGVSLNPSLKFKNQEPRTMLFWQVIGDINQFNQQAGRIDRSGQDDNVLPSYKIMAFDCPAEKRVMGNLEKKDGSLKANTRADRDTGLGLYGVPMMNRVGDLVTLEVLKKHPDQDAICKKLSIDLKSELNNFSETGIRTGTGTDTGLHNKVSGRLSRMILAESEPLLAEMEEAYLNRIEWLDQQGINPLKTQIHDFQGTEVMTHEIFPRSGPSEFEGPVKAAEIDYIDYIEPIAYHRVEKVMSVNRENLGKKGIKTDYPLKDKWGEIEAALNAKLLQTGNTHARDFMATKKAQGQDELQSLIDSITKNPNNVTTDENARDRLVAQVDNLALFKKFKDLIGLGAYVRNFPASKAVYDCDKELADLVVTRMVPPTAGNIDGKADYSLAGSWSIRLTSPDPAVGQFDLSLRQLMSLYKDESRMKVNNEPLSEEEIKALFHDEREPQSIPSKRFVLVGQLFRAYEIMETSKSGRGKAGVFTADGELRRGIIMPRTFDVSAVAQLLNSDFTMSQPEMAKAYLKRIDLESQHPVMYTMAAFRNHEWARRKEKPFTCGRGAMLSRDAETGTWKLSVSAVKKNSKKYLEDHALKEMLATDFATAKSLQRVMEASIPEDQLENIIEHLMVEHNQSFHGYDVHADWYRTFVKERGERLIKDQQERDKAAKEAIQASQAEGSKVQQLEDSMVSKVDQEALHLDF